MHLDQNKVTVLDTVWRSSYENTGGLADIYVMYRIYCEDRSKNAAWFLPGRCSQAGTSKKNVSKIIPALWVLTTAISTTAVLSLRAHCLSVVYYFLCSLIQWCVISHISKMSRLSRFLPKFMRSGKENKQTGDKSQCRIMFLDETEYFLPFKVCIDCFLYWI